ncbi:MAG: ATP-binding protein [Paludibacteraceae bacterium]|nr:ATP-binding protein [Paludibacteraceae bacterium]
MFARKQYAILKERLAEDRDKIQVLVGPRQVGKSTVLKQVLRDIDIPYMYVTADVAETESHTWISDMWQTARSKMNMNAAKEYLLVIDEVHKISNWSEVVKKEWDLDTFNDVNIKIVLSGSSRLLLKDGLTESLAGRFELIKMLHWSFSEMREAFGIDINQYIYFGGYPGSVKYIGDARRWRTYVKDAIIRPAIESDIFKTKVLYKPELMRRLFELGCLYSGEEFSLNKMLGELVDVGNVTTLANYLITLNESCLLCGMHKYANDNARKYNSIPKFMVYNSALLSAQSGVSYEKAYTTPKLWGRWVESAVGAYLLNNSDELDYKLYYWRERDDEVDFILHHQNGIIAIEVKSGRVTSNRGLPLFREKFHPKASVVIGSDYLSVEDFLACDLDRMLHVWLE